MQIKDLNNFLFFLSDQGFVLSRDLQVTAYFICIILGVVLVAMASPSNPHNGNAIDVVGGCYILVRDGLLNIFSMLGLILVFTYLPIFY